MAYGTLYVVNYLVWPSDLMTGAFIQSVGKLLSKLKLVPARVYNNKSVQLPYGFYT